VILSSYLRSRQFIPGPRYTRSGTCNWYAPSISRLTSARTASTPSGGHSNTSSSRKEYVTECVDMGASGYILKEGPVDQLLTAIREVHRGGSYNISAPACSPAWWMISECKAAALPYASPVSAP